MGDSGSRAVKIAHARSFVGQTLGIIKALPLALVISSVSSTFKAGSHSYPSPRNLLGQKEPLQLTKSVTVVI